MDIIYDGKKKNNTEAILEQLQVIYPGAATRLDFGNIFELVVAVVLSAQSTDEQVNRVTPGLFARVGTPAAMAQMDIAELESLIRGVGIYKNKAQNLKNLAIKLIEQYDGQVPDSFEELLTLPGVGRKSANVIMAVGFNKPGLGVDTHVQRVAYRLGLASGKKPNVTELELKEQIPPEKWGEAHHLLIYHGRTICKARKPDCERCPIYELCRRQMD